MVAETGFISQGDSMGGPHPWRTSSPGISGKLWGEASAGAAYVVDRPVSLSVSLALLGPLAIVYTRRHRRSTRIFP